MHLNEAGRWKNKIHASYPGIFVTLITAAASNAEHVKNKWEKNLIQTLMCHTCIEICAP